MEPYYDETTANDMISVVDTPETQNGFPPSSKGGVTNASDDPTTDILATNGCPVCRVGVIEPEYPCIAVACAIFLFPLGILCCLACKEKICTNCGAQF